MDDRRGFLAMMIWNGSGAMFALTIDAIGRRDGVPWLGHVVMGVAVFATLAGGVGLMRLNERERREREIHSETRHHWTSDGRIETSVE